MATLDIHTYTMGGKTRVLDVNSSLVFEVDALARDILDLFETFDTDNIRHQLITQYPAEEIEQTIEELKSFVAQGLFVKKEISGPDLVDQPIDNVRLDINPACNLQCRYCFTGRATGTINGPAHPMPLPQILKVVDRCLEAFEHEETSSSLTFEFGYTGEPLLVLDLFRQVQAYIDHYALTTGRAVRCLLPSTNATLLTPEVAEELPTLMRHQAVIQPVISLDGPKPIHDAMRVFPTGQGSYDRILPLVQQFLTQWPASASAVVSGTQPFITEIFSHLFSLGFRTILMKPVRVPPTSPMALNSQTITAVKAEYQRFIAWLLQHDDHYLLWYLSALHPMDFFKRFLGRLLVGVKIRYRCPAGKSDIAIDAQGDIYPCDSFVGIEAFKLGNIVNGGLDAQRRAAWFQLTVERKPVCATCWARYLCGGGCYHSAWLAMGRIETPDPVECELVQHLIECAMFLLAELHHRNPQLVAALSSSLQFRPAPEPPPIIVCPFVEHSFPVDADDLVWQRTVPLHLDHETQVRGALLWQGPADLSGNVRLLWDIHCLYLRVEVTDDHYNPPSSVGYLPFGDSVQMAVVPVIDGPTYEYGIAQIRHHPVLVRTRAPGSLPLGAVPGVAIRIEQRGATTIYCVAVPWTEWPTVYPAPGVEMGFNLLLNECDHPDQPRAWMEWTPGMVVERNSHLFGRLRLIR